MGASGRSRLNGQPVVLFQAAKVAAQGGFLHMEPVSNLVGCCLTILGRHNQNVHLADGQPGRSEGLVVKLGNDAIQQPELVRNTGQIQLRRFSRGNHGNHISCIYNYGTLNVKRFLKFLLYFFTSRQSTPSSTGLKNSNDGADGGVIPSLASFHYDPLP